MNKRMFNVIVKRDNGKTYAKTAYASSSYEAIEIVSSKLNKNDKVISAYFPEIRDNTVQYGNFIIKKDKYGMFDIYKYTSNGENTGKRITIADSFNKAFDKAKLLQLGFEECLKAE